MRKITFLFLLAVCWFVPYASGGGLDEFLILQDIGQYKMDQPVNYRGKMLGGPEKNQFGNEVEGYYTHYSTSYDGGEGYAAPGAQVRVYDSTEWMLHDLESSYKDYEDGAKTRTRKSAITIKIDNNLVIRYEISGGSYAWVSNNNVVRISYRDPDFEYPVPMEVISAYLEKYPSTLPANYQIRHPDNEAQFIRNEFEQLITFSARWVELIQEEDPELKKKLKDAAYYLEEFAKHRKVYFDSIFDGLLGDSIEEDIRQLEFSHMRSDQEEFIRTKLAEYQEWWQIIRMIRSVFRECGM